VAPVPPPPNPAARRAAIDAALRRFDGIEDSPVRRKRPSLWQWASTHRAVAGGLLTAMLIAVVSIPAIQIAIRDHPSEVATEGSLSEVAPRNAPVADNEQPAAPADAQVAANEPPLPASAAPSPRPAKENEQVSGFVSPIREEKSGIASPAPMRLAPAAPALAAPPPPPPPTPPPAEPEAQADAKASDVGNIVVTGSRIRSSNMESAAPVSVINAASDFLSRLQDAFASDDRRAVMLMIGLPLRVRFGGDTRTYRTAKDVERDYDRIFTPQVRASVQNSSSYELLSRDGGKLKGNGSIWFGCGLRQCSSDETMRIREVHL
jgi:hypothetical protein